MKQVLALKNVKVSDETHRRLSKRGQWGQTMDEIIKELLDTVENKPVRTK